MVTTFALHSNRVLTPAGLTNATVLIHDGLIKEVKQGLMTDFTGPFEDVGESVLMPGQYAHCYSQSRNHF